MEVPSTSAVFLRITPVSLRTTGGDGTLTVPATDLNSRVTELISSSVANLYSRLASTPGRRAER